MTAQQRGTVTQLARQLAGQQLGWGEVQRLADEHGVLAHSLRAAISRARAEALARGWDILEGGQADPGGPGGGDPLDPPAALAPAMDQPLDLDLACWAYASDFHSPHHNVAWTKRLAYTLDQRGVDTLVIGGDFFDFAVPSRHPRTVPAVPLEDGLAVAGKLLRWLAALVDRVVIIPGNHCLRITAALGEPVEFRRVVGMALCDDWPRDSLGRSKLTITSLDYVHITSGGQPWTVGHPRWFSAQPGKGVSQVATLKQRHIIGAHNHIVGMVRSACGRYWAIDPGHMTDPSLHAYHRQSDGLSKYPAWSNGFVVVEDGRPTLYADGLVDWPDRLR